MKEFAPDPAHLEQHISDNVPLAPRTAFRVVGADDRAEAETVVGLAATQVAQAPASTEVPGHLLNPPGLVGAIARWINETALYPQPVLALGAAITVVGAVAGRKYAGPTKSGTHLYTLAIAPTGAGKNHASKMAKRLMRKADMADLIGPGQFMSEPAVYQQMAKTPQVICFMDEFGSYLQKINSPKGSGYEKAVTGVLRILWGASFDVVDPPRWADSKSRDELKPISSPSLAIYGMSVPDDFYAALNSVDIANGFLNRFLVLPTDAKPDEVEPERDEDLIPDPLVGGLQKIGATACDPRRSRITGDIHVAEERITWAPDGKAQAIYVELRRSCQDRGDDAKLLSRTPEMAVRLATILAIGRGRPVIDAQDMRWGADLALWSGERMIADTNAYMVESEHQGRLKEVLRHIQAAKRKTISRTDLNRKVKHKFTGRQLAEILSDLADSETITIERVPGSETGARRPTDIIRLNG